MQQFCTMNKNHVSGYSVQHRLAKHLTFMVAYGMKPADALAKLGLSEAEAQRIATAHRDRYPLLHEALSCNS
jgi:DNA polymerase I-like protein with 3'-5' exonuclease and polymerase domains